MTRRLGLLLCLVLILTGVVPATAHTPQEKLDEIEQQIHDLRHRIEDAQGQRSTLAEELAATEARMADLRAQVAGAQAAVEAVQAEIRGVEAELDQVRLDLAAQKERLAQTRDEIRRTRELVRRRAVEMYVEGSDPLSGMLLALEEISQVTVGMEYASQVLASSEQLVHSLEVLERQEEEQKSLMEQQEAQLEKVVATLEQRRAELETRKQELEAARAAVAAERDRQKALLAGVESDIAHFEGEISGLEEDAERIKEEILARQRAAARPAQSGGGGLVWPTAGSVGSGFGYRVHPISGVSKLHTGVDIGGSYGQPIVAAASGTAILVSWYGGYGNTVVIDHGGGLATLYAHQSSTVVGLGGEVEAGQVIGYVGSTGYSTGPHLHFEVRVNGDPVDPMGHL